MADPIIKKRCWACKTFKPLTEFWKDRRTPDGIRRICKSCARDKVMLRRKNPIPQNEFHQMKINTEILIRIFSKIEISVKHFYKGEPCWEWQGARCKPSFYGRIMLHGVEYPAHRGIYNIFVEIVPEHLQCDHLCRNHGCVNPTHIEPVTDRVNILRGVGLPAQRFKQTHCKRGHELSDDNLRVNFRKGKPQRHCFACAKMMLKAAQRNREKQQCI